WRPLHVLLLLPALLLWSSSAEAGPLFESLSLLPSASNVSEHLQHQLAALELLAGLASLAADTAGAASLFHSILSEDKIDGRCQIIEPHTY
ncbi:hypothetical protein HW555_013796, partial [Spodoptera exigua]